MRPFLIWRDDWLLGYVSLDQQHLEIVEALNNLHRTIVQKKESKDCVGLEEISRQLTLLRELTERNFQAEEALMQKYGFPGSAEHHREHAMLLAEMQELLREIKTGSKAFTLGTLTALKYWQIDHLLYSDRKFADYLMCQLPSGKVVEFKNKAAVDLTPWHSGDEAVNYGCKENSQ
jgi:hemerythrin-like metal-binding protein